MRVPPDDVRVPVDATVVLVMEHSDRSHSYYRVPRSWALWATRPFSEPPEDLLAAYRREFATSEPIGEFAHRTRQALALDDRWLGGSLAEVVEALGDHAGRIIELHGTTY